MSNRDYSDAYSRGSKSDEKSRDDRYRAPKDDSRDRYRRSKRDRSRSLDRSNRRSRSREDKYRSKHKTDRNEETDTIVREMSISPPRDDERIPSPPPAPKISLGFNRPLTKPAQPIKLLLAPSTQNAPIATKPSKVASVFGDGSDEEPEEMPAEARMRMRNIGRDTPTSAGPNSFGKTKHGFCDPRGTIQKNLKDTVDQANPGGNSTLKYSSTIHK